MKANTCALALATLLSIVSGFSQDDYLIRTQWGQKAPYNAFCPSIQGEKAPLSSAAVALGQLVHFHQHPRNPAGKVRYFSRQIHEVDFSQEIWRYAEIESEPAALARLLFHLDVGMRTNFFPNVSLTEWVQMLDFVRNNLQYQVEELQSNTGFQELEFEIRSALSANTPVLFQAYDSLSRAYHYGLIDGGRNIAGRLEYHINWGWGGYADGWYDPGKPGYPFSRYRFKPRLALLTPKAPAVTNISASLDEKDQIRLSWDAPLRDNRLLYQVYRQKRGDPSSFRLVSGWSSGISFVDEEVEPGTYYEYFVFAAFNGSEATNSLAATATGKAFSEVCPSIFRIADQTEDLTLLEWDPRDAYDYQVVKTDPVSGDTISLSLWIPGPYFLEETLEGGQKHLLQLYARHRNTGKVFPCDQMILLDKTGSLPSISLQVSKGQYADRIEVSWNAASGYLYQLGKWQNARWEMLTAPSEDTLFVDAAGGIPNGDTIWYALFLLKDSLSIPQRAGEDFGFTSGNIPVPVIQDVLLSLEESFIQLFWDEPDLQVRVFRGSPDRPDALYPISDWLEGESDYKDLNIRKGIGYLYAIRTRKDGQMSTQSPFRLVSVPGDFSSLCDVAVSLECSFRGVLSSGDNHVVHVPGVNAALGNKDLVLFFPGAVVYRGGYEVRISSSSDAFTAYAFRDCSGEENFAVFKIRQGEDLFLSEISREPFYLLLESAGSEFDFGFDFEINVDVKCSSGFEIQPVLPCENVHRIRFPIQRGSTYSGSPAIDVLPCYPGPFPGKEIVYAYRQDIFFSQDTLTIRLICAESWKDSVDLFLVADCSGEDTCSLLSSKMEVIGGSLIIEKRYIVDPFEEVFIIIDSRTENPIPYELQVGLPYDNGRREFWGIFDQKVTCNPASFTYDLELTFNIAGIFEVLSTAFEVQNPGINQYVIKDIPLLREIELTLVERLSAGSDQAAVIVIPPVECDCSGFMEAGLQLPERIVCADPQNLFSAREASGQTVIWHTRFEDLEFEETGFEFYLQGELNVYAQRHDSLRGCYSFRQTLPNQFPEENFELISIPQSCKNKGSIKAQPLNSTAPLFYQWSAHPDRETPYLEGLSAGSYSVTITDEKGCQYALEAEVEEEAVPILKGIEIKDASCSLANGAIELIPSMPDLQMFIDTLPGVRQENLKNGLYEIHVFSNNGCYEDSTVLIQETEPLVVSQIEVVHPNCSEPNGHIEFQVDNYREYSISWIGETDYSLPFKEKLAPGRYTAEIKRNGSSCNKVLEFEMKAERPLIIIEPVIDVQQADCSGTKAAIRLDLDASMDSLFWNSGFLGSSPDALGLGSGLYHFSLKDTNNCMVQTEVIINSLSDAGVFFSPIIQDSCNRHVGSIELHYYSPSAMAQSNWVLPAQSQSNMLRNLGKGKYPFAINYPGGCVLKDSFEIINETPFTSGVTVLGEACGLENTKAVVNITGQGAPFIFEWQGMETTDTLRSPERGVNYLLIRNTFGCEDSLVFHVTLLPSLQLDTGLIIQPNCLIDNGSIEVSYSGGTAPYTYQWSVKESADAPSIGFLGPGKYQVDIRDKNGCTRFDTFFLINQDIYRIQAAYRAPTCLGDQNGWIALSVFPDTFKQVEYTWFNGFAGASINNLAQGIYSVTVDADGCYQEVSLALNDPPFFSLVALPPLKGCEGELGSIMPMVFGGVPPYRFELNGQLFQLDTTVLFIENIGIQRLTVSDSLGCAREQELLPEVFPEPEVFASMDTTIVKGNPVILRLEGFEQYAWTNVPAGVCRNCPEIRFVPQKPDSIFVAVTDNNGCIWKEGFFIDLKEKYSELFNAYNAITPNGDGVNDFLAFEGLESYPKNRLNIFNKWGVKVYSRFNYKNDWNGKDMQGNDLPAGEYYYVLEVEGDPIQSILFIVRE